MLEREAADRAGRVLELEDVLVGVDAVAEEVHAVQEEPLRLGKREGAARGCRLDVRIFCGVTAPRRLRRRRDEFVHLVRGVRHPHYEQILDGRAATVRNDDGGSLRRPADEVAGVVGEAGHRVGQLVRRCRRCASIAVCRSRRIYVHHVEFYVRVSHVVLHSVSPGKASQ